MFGCRTIAGRNAVIGLGLALVIVTAAFGAVLGATLPAHTGLKEITVLSVAFTVSPLSLAVYGAIAIGILVAASGLAIGALSRFDDDAVER